MILITGATGFVGANVVRQLLKSDNQIRCLVRKSSNLKAIDGLPIELVYGDVTNVASLKAAMKGVRFVYHVAGMFEIGPFQRKQMWQVNVEGTQNVCQVAMEASVEKLVYTSSTNALGYGSAEHPATEESEYNFGRFHLPYADTKYEAEQVVHKFITEGLPCVIVNPSFMLGQWDVKPTSGQLILSAMKAPVLFYTSGAHTLIDVEDAAVGHVLAMEKGVIGERYILATQGMTYRELMSIIKEVTGSRAPLLPMPYPVAITGGYLGTTVGYLMKGRNLLANHLSIRMSYLERYVDASKAVQELGLPQNDIAAAVEKAYRWFVENGY